MQGYLVVNILVYIDGLWPPIMQRKRLRTEQKVISVYINGLFCLKLSLNSRSHRALYCNHYGLIVHQNIVH